MTIEPCAPSALLDLIVTEHDLQCFFVSRVIMRCSKSLREQILEGLKERFPSDELGQQFAFLAHACSILDDLAAECRELAKQISVQDLLGYVEFLITRCYIRGIGPDGKHYPENVANSMAGHLASAWPHFLSFAVANQVPMNGGKPQPGIANICQRLVERYSEYVSVYSEAIDVLYGTCQPTSPEALIASCADHMEAEKVRTTCKFFLSKIPPLWRRLEIYRDLNYGWQWHIEEDANLLTDILTKTGALKQSEDGAVMRFDFARSHQFAVARKFHKTCEMLRPIYGPPDTAFRYAGREYTIRDLVNVAQALSAFHSTLRSKQSRFLDRNAHKLFVHVFGLGELARRLRLKPELRPLLPLFEYCVDTKSGDASACGYLRNGKCAYIIPTMFLESSPEKTIDRILSRNDVAVQFPENAKKGTYFERHVAQMLKDAGFPTHRTNRDEAKGVPEIDGIFALDDEHIILFEAKCSIKPETREEAFTFAENHLTKAATQLIERVKAIRNNHLELEKRIPLHLHKKTIVPIIITNHSYFTGLTIMSSETPVFTTDYNLLQMIIAKRIAPEWSVEPHTNAYRRREKALQSPKDQLAAITSPARHLGQIARPTVQFTPRGIAFEIWSDPEIDYYAGLPEAINAI